MPKGLQSVDEGILTLYQQRDQEAIAETARRYGAALRSLARRILGSPEDAEEVENEVYLTAWEQISPASPQPLLPWRRTICRRRALDRLDEKTAGKRGGGQGNLTLEELADSLSAGEDGRHWVGEPESSLLTPASGTPGLFLAILAEKCYDTR